MRRSYVFLVVSDNAHSVWNCALASVLAKACSDRELYDDLFQAASKDAVVQAVARVAVKIQIVGATTCSHAAQAENAAADTEEAIRGTGE